MPLFFLRHGWIPSRKPSYMCPHSTGHLLSLWWKQDEVAFPATQQLYAGLLLSISAVTSYRQKEGREMSRLQKFMEKSPEAKSNISQVLTIHPGLLSGADSLYKGDLALTSTHTWPPTFLALCSFWPEAKSLVLHLPSSFRQKFSPYSELGRPVTTSRHWLLVRNYRRCLSSGLW